jgi:hypothetical protein
MNSRENAIWFVDIVDRGLLFLFHEGICISLGEMGDPQDLFQQWWERDHKYGKCAG